jgi:hypothetical protein
MARFYDVAIRQVEEMLAELRHREPVRAAR